MLSQESLLPSPAFLYLYFLTGSKDSCDASIARQESFMLLKIEGTDIQ